MSNTHPIPEPSFSGKNMRDMAGFLEVASYGVAEWTPEDNGQGKPEAVILHFDLGKALDGVSLGIRLKSKGEANRLIKMLEQYRDQVWS